MYRLLLVDDEYEAIEYFSRLLSTRSGLPLELFTAHSAQEALDCLDHIRVDVVLSDIKMPRMNGLQMYGVIKQRWPRCRVIFLSGVLDFDYVYSSIQERKVRYLTKLEPTEKIIATIREVLEEIEQEYQQILDAQRIQTQLEQALPFLQERCVFNIISGILVEPAEMQSQLDALQLPLSVAQEAWMVGGLFDHYADVKSDQDFRRLSMELCTIADTYLSEHYRSAWYLSEQRYFLWLLQPKRVSLPEEAPSPEVLLNGQLEYMQAACRKSLQLSVSFVYPKRPLPLAEAPEGFIRVKSALGNKRSLSEDSVIFSCDDRSAAPLLWIDPSVMGSRKLLPHLHMLEGYLELGQKTEFFALFPKIVDSLRQVESRNYGPALEIYYSVATLFIRMINTYQLTEKLAFHLGLYKLLRLDEHQGWGEAVDYLYQLAQAMFAIRESNADQNAADAVLFLQRYMGEHLSGNLSLVALADMAHLNPSYLSRLFKERVGRNLYDYIVECRMAKAQELLRDPAKRIQDIAKEVGYDSAQSFTRVFRRSIGKTPSEFREGGVVR